MDARNLVGTTIDSRYDVTRVIGAGGMGAVYEAQHVGTGRRVAIKVISTGDLTKDAQLVGRFQREAKAAGAIDTQHICQVLDTGTDPTLGLPFMVMEYMTGEDVQQLLRRVGPLSADLSLRIVAQVCVGLQKAHETNVVHRDIKPANIFLAKSDADVVVVKVLDFGIAKVKMETASEAGDAGLTRTGTMLGSPLYMSPEQARGSKSIDHRADVWSLGVVLYEMLCGRTPFHHIDALGELIIAICSEEPKAVQDYASWVSPEVAAIVHRALRVNPAERYQTAEEMLDAVKALLPSGMTVDEPMLVGLSETQRSLVAKRLTMPPPQAPMPIVSLPPPPPLLSEPPPAQEGSGTTGGVSAPTERRPELRARSSAPLVVVGVMIGVAIAGGVAFKVVSDQQAAANAAAATLAAQPVPRTADPGPAASAAPLSVVPAPKDVTQRVVIRPGDAAVTVNGKDVPVIRGFVEISGGMGSNHKIRVTAHGETVEESVTISEHGAQPPMVEVDDKKKAGGPKPKATAQPTTAPGPAPKPQGGIEEKFE